MKITRGHFNRKILSFGLLMFLAVSLISTGFAAWIMSTGSSTNTDGNLNVGTITDSSLEFTDIVFAENANKNILFAPKAGDTTGDVKWDSETEVSENLSITFSTTLAPVEYVKDLTLKIVIPQTVIDAATAGYIKLPSCYVLNEDDQPTALVYIIKDGVAQEDKSTTNADGVFDGIAFKAEQVSLGEGAEYSKVFNISVTIEFAWGEKFFNGNPSETLDSTNLDSDGEDLTYEKKFKLLTDFKRTLYGFASEGEGALTDEEVAAYDDSTAQTLKYNVILNAIAK